MDETTSIAAERQHYERRIVELSRDREAAIDQAQQLRRERDRYLRALQELAWNPIITVAEHVDEAPWLGDILAEAERKPTPQR